MPSSTVRISRTVELAVVDPERLTRCAPEAVGEIWLRGPSVARGYLNRPEKARETFDAYLMDAGEGPFLRTGDLGFVCNGELFITGRLKDLIIINGRNHYPQDIEQTVERSHPAVRARCCAAFSAEREGEEQLVVVTEIERQYRPRRSARVSEGNGRGDLQDIVKAIRRAVAEHHELRVSDIRLLKPATIMKTSSGKIQRRACRARSPFSRRAAAA